MLLNPRLHRTARSSSRGGFTLVELLVVIGIIAILAGVALGPITNGIRQAKHNASMQQGRQIGQLCFAASTDNVQNGNTYPCNTTSTLICQGLINAGYDTDPTLFCVPGAVGGQLPYVTSTSTIALAKTNICYNFTAVDKTKPATGGISPSTSDLIPVLYFTGGTAVTFGSTPPTPIPLVLGPTTSPYGTDGAVVFYKGNNAAYLKAGPVTTGTISVFVSGNCTDAVVYQEVTP